PADVREEVMTGLLGAVNNADGTARPAFNGYTGVQVAGKTGTAEHPPKEDNALFVAMVNPNPPAGSKCIVGGDQTGCQYVVVVVAEEAGFGGAVAAPIARRIIDAINGNANPEAVILRPTKID